jgi:hypothetical protein
MLDQATAEVASDSSGMRHMTAAREGLRTRRKGEEPAACQEDAGFRSLGVEEIDPSVGLLHGT